ncbi:MAG: beta-ketoacyl-[acyl-carrier-protein] synthase family protein [Nitrospira sp.]|nr:beta-ketoacyl-[acyl-carrier-protein] synthase family protein [Nitrospira sp.]
MTDRRRVVVTGMGIVSPIGSNLDIFWHLLSHGETGIKPITSFDTSPFGASLAGEITDFDPTDFIQPKKARRMGRVSQFAVASALMAARDASLDLDQEDRQRVGVCFGTSVGGLKEAFEAHDSMLAKQYKHTNPFTMTTTFPNAVSAEVSIALGTHGECETYSIGCSSTANAIGRAYDLIRSHDVDIVIAGGAEAPLHPTIFSAMDAGRTLAPDHGGMIRNLPRPFDQTRCGIVLGEGAGCVILEEQEHAERRGAPIYAELEGWAFTTDAYSMARPDETGKEHRRSIERALMSAHWFPEEVDYINACGLGTVELDLIETIAIKQAMGPQAYRVPVSSFKSALGHAFAASGAFQLIGTVLALQHQFIPPTLHLTTPDPQCDLDYVAGIGRPKTLQRALVNSFGFGGKNIVIPVSRVDVPALRDAMVTSETSAAYHERLAAPALAKALPNNVTSWR